MHLTTRSVASLAALLLSSALTASARDVPQNVRDFYNKVRGNRECANPLASGFWSTNWGTDDFSYCGTSLPDKNIIYIQGRNGALANMDIDCDGAQGGPADDGRCGNSDDTQSITSFQWLVEGYGVPGVRDLNPYVHSYVVFGNTGSAPGWKTFDPQAYGVEPLSVMAVVCGDRLLYGVWADTNGDDGDHPILGETSISLATACYGRGITGNNGHDEDDVLYIAFAGADAVPGAGGANWGAKNFGEFQRSIEGLGNRLISRI